ncbi:MAG TPA: MerR family transcriptional regulator [Chloroflexota bacterium]|nr:MerR family transcriptional regulator [Chloroflexota bacterium]
MVRDGVTPGAPRPRRVARVVTAAELRRAMDRPRLVRTGRRAPAWLASEPLVDVHAGAQRVSLRELAETCGATVSAARRYARRGLLPDPLRSPSWGWLFPPRAVERLALIRAARAMGLSLAQIAVLCRAVEEASTADFIKNRETH